MFSFLEFEKSIVVGYIRVKTKLSRKKEVLNLIGVLKFAKLLRIELKVFVDLSSLSIVDIMSNSEYKVG